MNKSSRTLDHKPARTFFKSSLSITDLSLDNKNNFKLKPNSAQLHDLATEIGIIKVSKLIFIGTIEAQRNNDWKLAGQLRAIVVQECVATLNHVTTHIDINVFRTLIADARRLNPKPNHMIPDDDSLELLTDEIDIFAIARETLLLELPLYPHSAINSYNYVEGHDIDNSSNRKLTKLAELHNILNG